MSDHYYLKVIISAIIASTILAIILNFVLQLHVVDWSIIGSDSENEASKTWLAFWGALIAAIASFVMAIVSHRQNQDLLMQNERHAYNAYLQKQYNEFEQFLGKCEDVYSLRHLYAIINSFQGTNYSYCLGLFDKLEYSVHLKEIQIERFHKLLEQYPEFDQINKNLQKQYLIILTSYRNILAVLNNSFLIQKGLEDAKVQAHVQTESVYKRVCADSLHDELIRQGKIILNNMLDEINK